MAPFVPESSSFQFLSETMVLGRAKQASKLLLPTKRKMSGSFPTAVAFVAFSAARKTCLYSAARDFQGAIRRH